MSIFRATLDFPESPLGDVLGVGTPAAQPRKLTKMDDQPPSRGYFHKTSNIAWLLSFPNSGTTYTLANVEWMTNKTTATNYESEVFSDVLYPVNPDEDAPFLFSPHLDTGNFVL